MFVGVCRVRLRIPENDSLKGKRSVIRKVIERTANRFSVAVAEVAEQDAHRSSVIGLAVVSGDAKHANEMVDRIVSFIDGLGEALIVDRRMEIVPFGEVISSDPADRLAWSDFEDSDGT